MNAARGIVRVYGAFVGLYPRRFRDEYGSDMVQHVRDACRDEPALRVARRVAADLVISIPTQHLEAHMHRSSSALVPIIYTSIAAAGAVLAAVGGSNAVPLVFGLLVAVAAGTAAVIGWRGASPVRGGIQTAHWWRFVLAGPVIVGGVIVAADVGVEAWFAGLFAVFLAFVLTGVGLLLGLVRLATRRPPVVPS